MFISGGIKYGVFGNTGKHISDCLQHYMLETIAFYSENNFKTTNVKDSLSLVFGRCLLDHCGSVFKCALVLFVFSFLMICFKIRSSERTDVFPLRPHSNLSCRKGFWYREYVAMSL